MIRILYFARLATRLGKTSEDVALPPTITDMRALLAWLRERGGNWAKLLDEADLKMTVNRQFVEPDAALKDGDEVALINAGA
jgi:molybdopterin synthase sulfur carrier subunit